MDVVLFFEIVVSYFDFVYMFEVDVFICEFWLLLEFVDVVFDFVFVVVFVW